MDWEKKHLYIIEECVPQCILVNIHRRMNTFSGGRRYCSLMMDWVPGTVRPKTKIQSFSHYLLTSTPTESRVKFIIPRRGVLLNN